MVVSLGCELQPNWFFLFVFGTAKEKKMKNENKQLQNLLVGVEMPMPP